MSHIPLLAKHAHAPPRLSGPRRGPQVCCFCLLASAVLLLVQPPLIYAHFYNVTHAHTEPPPPEMHRLLAGTRWEDTDSFGGLRTPDGSSISADHLRDLLVTVRYLADRALSSR